MRPTPFLAAVLLVAPLTPALETAADISRNADEIYLQAVLTRAMPPNNITEMPDSERRMLRDWLAAR